MDHVITIADRRIGPGSPCFVIAEAGVNHNGDVGLAVKLIDAAVAAGADAVKFQSFRADELASRSAPKAGYQMADGAPGESQWDMLKRLEFGQVEFARLKDYCERVGIIFLSSPFDVASVDLLEGLGVAALKIPSGELTNHALLERAARSGKSILMSTGMCEMEEVAEAVAVIERSGAAQLALLHCVSTYPAAAENCNLRAMATMRDRFGVPVGFSDHTLGADVAIAATALGADVIEKHLTLDRSMNGPDHAASMEPGAFGEMVKSIRRAASALGDGVKGMAEVERANREVVRRSVVLNVDLAAGVTIERSHLSSCRPAGGIRPEEMESVVGKRTARAIKAREMLHWSDLV